MFAKLRQLLFIGTLLSVVCTVTFSVTVMAETCVDAFAKSAKNVGEASSDLALENALETAKVIAIERPKLNGHTTHFVVTLEGGLKAIFKPAPAGRTEHSGGSRDEWVNKSDVNAEVFAYRVDRLLNLRMVPVTVIREINGVRGSLQLWVHADDSKPTSESLMKLSAFDYLINNLDRGGSTFHVVHGSRNTLTVKGKLIAIDHALAFQPLLPAQIEQQQVGRDPIRALDLSGLDDSFIEGLRFGLTRENLRLILVDPSYEEVIREIVQRRNKLRARIAERPI